MNDVVGIGSALLDLTFEVKESVLSDLGLKKGTMHLIDEARSKEILDHMKGYPVQVTPGGSAANTMAGVANLGGSSMFVGKVGVDPHGKRYTEDTAKTGVVPRIGTHRSMTGHAITFITPDSERTFATHLGAALHLTSEDVAEEDIRQSKILHIEGYILEGELKKASVHAMEIAKKHGVKISIDLADPSLITRNLGEFKGIVRNYADIVFANEDEAQAFSGERGADALEYLHRLCEVAVVKLGADGSLIRSGDRVHAIQAYKTNVINTNGAGDMYAAGVLYGISHGLPIDRAGRIGSYAASLVVAGVGARFDGRIDISAV